MKHHRQTIFGNGKGNCFSTCVACILELPVDVVPNFCCSRSAHWVMKANEWLSGHGLAMLDVELDDDGSLRHVNALCNGIPVIISGKSPRGDFSHAVVGRYCLDRESFIHQLEYIHDPHPDDLYLDGPAKAVTFFLVTKPGPR